MPSSSGLTLDEIAHINSFVDPHIGGGRGFVEWVRVTGKTSLLVLPYTRNAHLEAWVRMPGVLTTEHTERVANVELSTTDLRASMCAHIDL